MANIRTSKTRQLAERKLKLQQEAKALQDKLETVTNALNDLLIAERVLASLGEGPDESSVVELSKEQAPRAVGVSIKNLSDLFVAESMLKKQYAKPRVKELIRQAMPFRGHCHKRDLLAKILVSNNEVKETSVNVELGRMVATGELKSLGRGFYEFKQQGEANDEAAKPMSLATN
jgi:hypothetical protein